MNNPKIIIGLPAYNSVEHFRDSIESVLNQTYNDFILIIYIDGADDEMLKIANQYSSDVRLKVFSDKKKGMIYSWNKVLNISLQQFPYAKYFSWFSDHDILDKDFLKSIIEDFENNNDLSLIIPTVIRIDESSVLYPKRKILADIYFNSSDDDILRFKKSMYTKAGFGNMIYGIFKTDILYKLKGFSNVILPDRLILQKLSLIGKWSICENAIFYRRFIKHVTAKNQAKTLWINKNRPLLSFFPVGVVHFCSLFFFIFKTKFNLKLVFILFIGIFRFTSIKK